MNNNNRLNDISRFHMYSVAIVAKDIEEDGFIVECFPIENMTHVDGDIAYVEGITVSNEDIDNEAEVIVLNKSVTIKAKWLALGHSNRKTAPMVKKGEQVMLFRYANEDEFYWMTMYNEFDLRRKEKVIHYYSNTDNFKEDLHDDNTYWTKIDTINKEVSMHTSDNDGEITTYDLKMKTDEGYVELKDGKNNFFKLDSTDEENSFQMHLEAEDVTYDFHMHGTEKYVEIKDDAGNSFTLNTGLNTLTVNTLGFVIINTPVSMVNAAASASIIAPLVTIKGGKTLINP